jgi:hypothetical protein
MTRQPRKRLAATAHRPFKIASSFEPPLLRPKATIFTNHKL